MYDIQVEVKQTNDSKDQDVNLCWRHMFIIKNMGAYHYHKGESIENNT
jgi:hypothetical protein